MLNFIYLELYGIVINIQVKIEKLNIQVFGNLFRLFSFFFSRNERLFFRSENLKEAGGCRFVSQFHSPFEWGRGMSLSDFQLNDETSVNPFIFLHDNLSSKRINLNQVEIRFQLYFSGLLRTSQLRYRVSSLRACEAIQKKQHAKVVFYSGVYILVIRPFSISSKVGCQKCGY